MSVLDWPEQIVVPVGETLIAEGFSDAPGGPEQLRHCVPLQVPDAHLSAGCVLQEPLAQVDWGVAYPPTQDGPAPHGVPRGLLVARHTGWPVVQSMAPVWHSVLMPVVHGVPGEQALQVPVLSHTPAVEPMVQAVATGSRLHIPVEQERHVPQVVAQQIPEIQWPWVHWTSAEHVLPSAIVGVQAPPEAQ